MVLKCILGSIGHFVFFGLLVGLMIPGFTVYFILKPFIKDSRNFFQRGAALSYRLFYIFVPRVSLSVDIPKELPKGVIYISTHQSILDFPSFAQYIRDYLIFANVNLGKYKIVEKITHAVGVRYIKERNLDEVGEIYKEFEKHLESGKNVIYFPEGSRHTKDKLLPFKRGAFRLACKLNKPIVPIVIEGAQNVLPRKSFCYKTTKKTIIKMKMLPPLYPKNFKNEKELREFAQNLMQKTKDELSNF